MSKNVSNAHVLFMLDLVMAVVCCNHQDETTLTGSNKVFNTPSFPSVPRSLGSSLLFLHNSVQ